MVLPFVSVRARDLFDLAFEEPLLKGIERAER